MSLYFYEEAFSGLDVDDTGSFTAAIDVAEFRAICFEVDQASGTVSTAVLHFQCSCDTNDWFDVAGSEQTGAGLFPGVEINTRYVRVKVKTAEGSAGTADIIVQAKK